MSREYTYDEQGQFFPYFLLTILGLILAPLSYSTFAPSKQIGKSKKSLIRDPTYVPPRFETVISSRRRQAKKERRLKRFTALIIGWCAFAYMCYLIATTAISERKIWDPYEILGIDISASEKAIKSKYRKIALKYHPDKVRPGPNETLEMLNDRFVQITKAYKALTDEDIRNNYIQYGHPDGKQSLSIGIALPQWIVQEGNNYYVLAVYGLLFGILLPYTVGKWWYGTKKYTKDGVLVDSAARLFREYGEFVNEEKLVKILSAGKEMEWITGGERGKEWTQGQEAIIEKKLVVAGVPNTAMQELNKLDGWRRRALGLLWAYIYRVDLGSEQIEIAKLDVAPAAIGLIRSFHSICLAFGNTLPLIASMQLSQNIIQAVPPGHSPLLQIPYFTKAVIDAIEQDGVKNHWNVQRLMSLPEEKRKKLCVGKNLLSHAEYKSAMMFARHLPAIRVESAFFKVMGEKFITPLSLVQFVLKMRIVPPSVTPPPVDKKDLLDEDPDETDVDALLGRKSRWSQSSTKPDESSVDMPLAHSQYYPRDHNPSWYVFLADFRQEKLVVPPQAITSFDKNPDDFTVVTAKIQFQAPEQAGEYSFTMMCVNDSYLGIDIQQQVSLVVSDPSKVSKIEIDDISDPEEDSIAGQMSAMRGGRVAKKSKASDDSSDESDTDGEVKEESETDTETEDES